MPKLCHFLLVSLWIAGHAMTLTAGTQIPSGTRIESGRRYLDRQILLIGNGASGTMALSYLLKCTGQESES